MLSHGNGEHVKCGEEWVTKARSSQLTSAVVSGAAFELDAASMVDVLRGESVTEKTSRCVAGRVEEWERSTLHGGIRMGEHVESVMTSDTNVEIR